MSNTYNYKIIRGDTLIINLRYLAENVPVNFTGSRAEMIFRYKNMKHTLESPGSLSLGSNGVITGSVSDEITSKWGIGTNEVGYQLRWTNSLGKVITLIHGFVEVSLSPIEE